MPPPRVSVVVSTYCGEELIGDCLRELEQQTIADQLQIIVIDSGSPQDERTIVERLQETYTNIDYVRTERETLYASWNRALELATGTYFANMNVDDWIRRDTLEVLAEALDQNQDADVAYSHWATTNSPRAAPSTTSTVDYAMHPPYVPALPLFYCYSGCVQFWRRSTALSLGGYDSDLYACGDLDILCRLTAHKGKSVLVPQVLQGFYSNPNGISHASSQSEIEQRAIFSRARLNTPIEVLYRIDPDRPDSRAAAWTALGNLAFQVRVPWHTGPLRDAGFALHCYEQALALMPSYEPALHNRYVVVFETHRRVDAEATLDSMTPDQAATVRGTDLRLVDPNATPCVVGPVMQAQPC
jgi:Glycosyl transferase family 2